MRLGSAAHDIEALSPSRRANSINPWTVFRDVSGYFHHGKLPSPVLAGRGQAELDRVVVGLDDDAGRTALKIKPRVLLASSSWWAFPVHLAIDMARSGVSVHAVCPRGHPLRKAASVDATYSYNALCPVGSLAKAIRRADPLLIIPCDDRTVSYLHDLHADWKSSDREAAALIERSLGEPRSFPIVARRAMMISLARNAGVSAPEMVPLDGAASVHEAVAQLGLPVVLKVDGSWGGHGVLIAKTLEDALDGFRSLSKRTTALVAIKRLLVDRDGFSILPWIKRTAPRVNAQSHARGRPVNCAIACWKGKLLACSSVEVVHARSTFGASTVVRHFENPAMMQVAETIVRQLDLSGLCGFDFLLDDATGAVTLIECNARATPLSHLDFGDGENPLQAFMQRLFGIPTQPAMRVRPGRTVAFFPQCWLQEPSSTLLGSSYHDVPWCEPAVMRDLMRRPWPERGLLARLVRRYRSSVPEAPWCIE